ncbi:MAG: hypothetical protein JW947_11150 [Sedimentisphaerales bacterium]|nr:hypothetical protein [Sedimentisphaerales bacterium]
MKIEKEPGLLLEAMKEHEEVIARLYDCYAGKFPEHRSFWAELSKEEVQHADWIDTLRSRIEEGSEDIVVDRFPVVAIEDSINFINRQITRAADADFELINALSTALDLEKALIENKYFEVFEGDSKETIRTLASLARSTREHRQRIQEMVQSNS